MTSKIIIDTDPGVDDALTFLLALASPEIQLEALTSVHGNIGIENTTRNALSVLELAQASHIPVARGCEVPLVSPLYKSDKNVHGKKGVGNANLPEPKSKVINQHAIDFLIEKVNAQPNQISIFPIGPLTNIALAIRKDPEFVKNVKELVIMGGSIKQGGNATPLAEFNIFADAHAAHVVFHAGIPIKLIPLDATQQCLLTEKDIERIGQINSPIARFIKDATDVYLDFYRKHGIDGCALHDPLTLATIIAPELLIFENYYVGVDFSGGISNGHTFADLMNVSKKPANMQVAMGVRGRAFIDLFVERMKDLCQNILS
ncbi:MAG TPA: nucleoside hydrolase [Anaerolineales bacterium]|nr:nucleoside hydrolase [Anaerolineales bacterium]